LETKEATAPFLFSKKELKVEPEVLVFADLDLIEIPVEIGDKRYILREANGVVACKYRNAILACAKMEGGKAAGFEGLADVEVLLVSLCLFRVQEDGSTTPIAIKDVQGWPNRVVKTLFTKAQEISELQEGEDTEESLTKDITAMQKKLKALQEGNSPVKNVPESTVVGST